MEWIDSSFEPVEPGYYIILKKREGNFNDIPLLFTWDKKWNTYPGSVELDDIDELDDFIDELDNFLEQERRKEILKEGFLYCKIEFPGEKMKSEKLEVFEYEYDKKLPIPEWFPVNPYDPERCQIKNDDDYKKAIPDPYLRSSVAWYLMGQSFLLTRERVLKALKNHLF